MKDLPILEAERLAIYFEETGAYQHKKMKEAERQNAGTAPNERTVLEIGDEDEE